MASKEERAKMMDPNRFKIAQNMSVVPGGPMNNNPMNVTSIENQSGSLNGVNEFPYGDMTENAPQMGANIFEPWHGETWSSADHADGCWYEQSGTLWNATAAFPNAEEPMEGMRLGQQSQQRGLFTSQFMGPTGSGALMPGALDPILQAHRWVSSKPQQVDGGETVPGSTPQKIQKKKGKK